MTFFKYPPGLDDVMAFVRSMRSTEYYERLPKKTRMEEALDRLKELQRSGHERARDDADAVVAEILVNLGCPELVEEWMAVPKWQRVSATEPSTKP